MNCFRLAPAKSSVTGYRETRRHLVMATPMVLAGIFDHNTPVEPGSNLYSARWMGSDI